MATFVLDPSVHVTASVPRTPRQFQRRQYRDKQFKGGEVEWTKKLERSTTVYVGNLSCYTNEYQLYELFNRCGGIKRIIMGLDKNTKIPCGFCFVEFDDRASAVRSVNYLNRTSLDNRDIHVDIDAGFEEGRQYGRGASGGQVGDERRRETQTQGVPGRGPRGSGPFSQVAPTRYITVVACIAMISALLIAQPPEPVSSEMVIRSPLLFAHRANAYSLASIRRAQLSETREQYEKAFASFLVNIMKAAKPTLLKAFMQATLADKQLKDIAIGLFFNNTSSDNDE